LGELGSLKNGMNFSKEAMGHGFPFINLQNIFGNNVIDVNKLELADATEKQLLEYSLLKGDVLFVRSSVKLEGVGEAALVPETLENTTYSGFIIRFRDEYGLNNDFKKYIFGTQKVRNQIMAQATNSANKNISQGVLENLTFEVPSFDEQAKIGEHFSNLDHLITLHQRKCEQTKKLKKYMLQKMFPQNGAKVPEIRFDGFTYDWEQRKFSEFVENVAVRNREGLELECYAVTNDRGFISQKEAHDDFGYMADVDKTAYNIVPPNSFAYNPARINVGSIGYYAGTENVIVSSLYEVFQTADYVEDGFLWHWFKSTHFPKWIERLQEGSVRLYFYYDKLIQCEMKMPSLEEQKKIGKYFDNLDHLITLHQRKCDELKKMKKYMLQNMFI
jgi:type I restriction enzyme S subunit